MSLEEAQHWVTQAAPLGMPWSAYALAAAAAVLSFAGLRFALAVGLRQARRVAERSENRIDDVVVEVLSRTNSWLLALASLLIGLGMLDLPARWHDRVDQLWFIALALQLALWAHRGLGLVLTRYLARHRQSASGAQQVNAWATLLSWGLRTVLWAVVLLAVLSNLGVNVTAFIASLGVGGIAVALAVQNILGDLFASLSIAVDKPFEVGDSIAWQSFSGTVEQIGLKTTRLRSLGGEQIVIANADLLKQPVRNYKRMNDRRVEFRFGISNQTPPEQAQAIPGVVRALVEADSQLRFDRAHLVGFTETAIEFEVVYVVRTANYGVHMDVQQGIKLALMREFARRGIALAAPAREVHVEQRTPSATPLAAGNTAPVSEN